MRLFCAGLASLLFSFSIAVPALAQMVLPFDAVAPDSAARQITLQEATINGLKAKKGMGLAFTTLDKKAIVERNQGQDIPYLLQNTVGAIATSDAGNGVGYTALRIRGTDGQRTTVTLNGVPVNDAESQGTFWVNMPDLASSAKSIQVQRGVGTSTIGGGAFGAGIHIETDDTPEEAGIYTSNTVGSFGLLKNTLQLQTGQLPHGFYASGRISRIVSKGYIDRSKADLNSYLLQLGFRHGRFGANIMHMDGKETTQQAWYGIDKTTLDTNRKSNAAGTDFGQKTPAYKNEVDKYGQGYTQLRLFFAASDKVTLRSTFFYTKGGGYYEQYKVNQPLANYGINPYLVGDSSMAVGDLIRRRWLRNDFYGATMQADWQPTSQLEVNLGGSANQYDGRNFGRIIWAQTPILPNPDFEYYRGTSIKKEANVFAKAIYRPNTALSLYADAQWRGIDYRIKGNDNDRKDLKIKRTYNFFNPKAGAEYTQGAWLGRASMGVAHRDPTRTSLVDAKGALPTAERLLDYEAAACYQTATIRMEVGAYAMEYKNQLVLTGELNDVGNNIYKNVPNSARRGIELQIDAKLGHGFSGGGNLNLSKNEIRRIEDVATVFDEDYNFLEAKTLTFTRTPLAYSPSVVANARFGYAIGTILELEVLGRYISSQYLDNTGNDDRKLAAYSTADFRLAYSPPLSWAKQLRFTLLLQNLASTKYSNNGYTYYNLVQEANGASRQDSYNFYFPQAPLSGSLGIELSL